MIRIRWPQITFDRYKSSKVFGLIIIDYQICIMYSLYCDIMPMQLLLLFSVTDSVKHQPVFHIVESVKTTSL